MEQLIRDYYDRFNQGDYEGMLALLHDDVRHDISQGASEVGKEAFRAFLRHMDTCYKERVYDLEVMVNKSGSRAAAEMQLDGTYLKTDGKLPEAKGQKYHLIVGAFFEIKDGKISRVATHYNMPDWLRQVG